MVGHILHHDSLTKNDIEGDIEGNIGRGKPRMEYTKQIMMDMRKDSYKELKELSYNREELQQTSQTTDTQRRELIHYM